MESILTSPEVVKVLGFWGILIAIVLWVFKELIVNMPLGNMTSEHKYKLLKLLIYILGGLGILFSLASIFFQYQKIIPDTTVQQKNTTIHTIVYNDGAEDSDQSAKLLEEHLEKVSYYTHLKINKNYLNEQSNLLAFLQNFKCESNDVIFFIAHGRGANMSDDTKIHYFPAFGRNISFSHNNLQKLLKEKYPRLLIIFYVSSNYTSNSNGHPVSNVSSFFNENEFKVNKQNDAEIYNKFYLYSKGDISLCSVSLGGWAWRTGGTSDSDVFVKSFISAFNDYEHRDSWKQLLFHAREQTYIWLKPNENNSHMKGKIGYPYFEGSVMYLLSK
jgi:hypothetical protein